MNIFILDIDPKKCAQYHCDKHCVKMILETTQLLNNAIIKYDLTYIPVYKKTHINHPASIWAAETRANFDWLVKLGIALCEEYTFRYGKRHKCQSIIEGFCSSKIPAGDMTSFKLCMPSQYHTSDAVESYRLYYKNEKYKFAKWKKREAPSWWNK
jgi:hypothetical protein